MNAHQWPQVVIIGHIDTMYVLATTAVSEHTKDHKNSIQQEQHHRKKGVIQTQYLHVSAKGEIVKGYLENLTINYE